MRHRDIPAGQNHVPYNVVFANDAERLAYAPTAADEGKLAFQADSRSLWVMSVAGGVETPVVPPSPAEVGADPAGTAASEVAAHEAALDPHPQYETAAEVAAQISTHTALHNPHGTTAADVGAVPTTALGAANGVATLGADSKIPVGQLPATAINDTFVVNNEAAMLALTAQRGDVAVRTDLSQSYILAAEPASTLGNWQALLTPSGGVVSVNGKTGVVVLYPSDIGAASDTHLHTGVYALTAHGHAIADITALQSILDGKAPLVHEHDQFVILAADVAGSSVAFADVTGSSFNLEANSLYEFEYTVLFQVSSSAAHGVGFALNGTVGFSKFAASFNIATSLTGQVIGMTRAFNSGPLGTSVDATNSTMIATIKGTIRTTTAGTLLLRSRGELSTTTYTVLADTLGRLNKVA